MKLILDRQQGKLLSHGWIASVNPHIDPWPVVKLFMPDGNATWLLTEIDPHDPDTAFGLCDLGVGFPELGPVSFAELTAIRGRFGLPVERDRHFKARGPLSAYTEAARQAERIVDLERRK